VHVPNFNLASLQFWVCGEETLDDDSNTEAPETQDEEQTLIMGMRVLLYAATIVFVDKYCESDSVRLEDIACLQRAILEHNALKRKDGTSVYGANISPHGWDDVRPDFPFTGLYNILQRDNTFDDTLKVPSFVSPLAHAVRHGNLECVEAMCNAGANGCCEGMYMDVSSHGFSKFLSKFFVEVGSPKTITPYQLALCGKEAVTSHTDDPKESEWKRRTWISMLNVLQLSNRAQEWRRKVACQYASKRLLISGVLIMVLLILNISLTPVRSNSMRFMQMNSIQSMAEQAKEIDSPDALYGYLSGSIVPTFFSAQANEQPMVEELNFVIGAIRVHQCRHNMVNCGKDENSVMSKLGQSACIKIDRGDYSTAPIKGPDDSNAQGFKHVQVKTRVPVTIIGATNGGEKQYPSSGYIVDLDTTNRSVAFSTIQGLKTYNWVSPKEGTAVVNVFFSLYNPHTHQVATARTTVEFWATGGTNVVNKIWILDWEEPGKNKPTFTLFFISFVVFMGFFAMEMLAWWKGHVEAVMTEIFDGATSYKRLKLSIKKQVYIALCGCCLSPGKKRNKVRSFLVYCKGALGNKYWQDPWNILEIIVSLSFFVSFDYFLSLNHARMVAQKDMANAVTDPSQFINLNDLTHFSAALRDQLGSLIVIVFFHALKAIQRIPYFGIGYRTLAITQTITSGAIVPFYIVLAFLMLGYSLGFMFAFGDESRSYFDQADSFRSVFTMNNGGDAEDFETLTASNWTAAIMLVTSLSFFLTVVLMNIFIAVVSEVYNESVAEAIFIFNSYIDAHLVQDMKTSFLDGSHVTVSKALSKTVNEVSKPSVDKLKQKESCADETREQTMRRVMPEIMLGSKILGAAKKKNNHY
jgi:hypothetical protein